MRYCKNRVVMVACAKLFLLWALLGTAISAAETSREGLKDLIAVRKSYRAYLAYKPAEKSGVSGRIQSAHEIQSLDPYTHGALMLDLAKDWYYHRRPESKKAFSHLFDLAWKQGFKKGYNRRKSKRARQSNKEVSWYGGRNYLKALGLMTEDLDAPHQQRCAEFLFYNSRMTDILNVKATTPGGFDTDYLHCDLVGAFGGILYAGTNENAVRNCQRLKRWLDTILKPSPGTKDFLKVDGTSFHHWTHYNAYMYAFTTFTDHLDLLKNTSFQISKTSYRRFRDATYALLLMCNGGQYAPCLAGRHPFSTSRPMSEAAYRKLAVLGGHVLGTGKADPFLARAFNRVRSKEDELGSYGKEPFPTGFWQFNYSPIGIYRQANWVATIKGMNTIFWGAEIYPPANRYGRYQSNGVVEILYPGGLAGSGFARDGWDWNHPCGATTTVLPWSQLLAERARVDEYNDLDFAGALAATLRPNGLNQVEGECGLYGMDFQHRGLRFKTSSFCMDGIIVRLGSDISNTIKDHPTVTTLFQGTLETNSAPIVCNEKVIQTVPYKTSLSRAKPAVIIDAYGTGYLVAKGSIVRIRRGAQTSPSQKGDTTTTSGNFAVAWIDHGKAPTADGYQYVVAPGTTRETLKALAQRVESGKTYTVLQRDRNAHIIHYLPKDLHGYVIFGGTQSLPGPVSGVDAKCLIMAQTTDKGLRITVVNPVLGLARRKYSPSKAKAITVTLKGGWRKSSIPDVHINAHEGGDTHVTFNTIDGLPVTSEFVAVGKK